MEELQVAMDELLAQNPEFTFFETSAELVKNGELNFEATQDPNVHVMLYQLFQRAKTRALAGRINADI